MNWKDVGHAIADIAPAIGTALGGPAGAAIGGLVSSALGSDNTPDAVAQAVKNDPQAAVKLQQLQNTHAETMAKIQADALTAVVSQGAQTVRAEVNSSSWITSNWRPMLMILFGVIVANNYIVAPYVQALFGHGVSLPIPPDLWGLLKIGIGGYVVGRSAEKIIPGLKK